MLLRNEGASDGDLRFTEVGMASGVDDQYDARGVAISDLDRDGDLDIVVNHNPGDDARHTARAVIYRNDVANGRPSVSFELQGTTANRDAVGAVVSIRVGERWQTRIRSAGSGYASQHSSRLHFGLAGKAHIDEVEVRWPGGAVDRAESLGRGAYTWIEGGQPIADAPSRPTWRGSSRAEVPLESPP